MSTFLIGLSMCAAATAVCFAGAGGAFRRLDAFDEGTAFGATAMFGVTGVALMFVGIAEQAG